jgi:hypothetical protein
MNILFREITMLKSLAGIMIAGFVFMGIGCASSSPIPEDSLLERNWGRSYESALYLQTANPDAGKSLEPITGMNGAASENVLEGYENSFESDSGGVVTNVWKLGQ